MDKALRPTLMEIGVITRPHGIAGEVKVQTSPGFLEALQGVKFVYLDDSQQPTRILGHRIHQNAILLKLDKVTTRTEAEGYRGVRVSIKTRDLPKLRAGEYYAHDLVGLQVVDHAGNILGSVVEVLATGSNDVYVVKSPEGKELLLPAIESVVNRIDLDAHTMSVVIPDGLLS